MIEQLATIDSIDDAPVSSSELVAAGYTPKIIEAPPNNNSSSTNSDAVAKVVYDQLFAVNDAFFGIQGTIENAGFKGIIPEFKNFGPIGFSRLVGPAGVVIADILITASRDKTDPQYEPLDQNLASHGASFVVILNPQ